MKKITIKRAIYILISLAALGLLVVFALSRSQKEISYKTVEAKLADVIQTVNETGTLKPVSEVDLSFLASGKVQRVNFKVGDMVKSGQLLAELDYSSLVISQQEAQANYEVATGNLNKLLAGASAEEKKLAEASVRQAESALVAARNEMARARTSASENIAQAEKNLKDLESNTSDTLTPQEQAITSAESNLSSAKTTYTQSINNVRDSSLVLIEDKISIANVALDAVNRILTDEDAKDYLSLRDPAYLDAARSSYANAQKAKQSANDSLIAARTDGSQEKVMKALTEVKKLLDITISALANTFSALNYAVTTTDFTQSDIDAKKATINTQTATINGALSAIESTEQSYRNAVTAYNTNVKSAEDALAQAKSAYNNALTAARNALNTARTGSEQQITSSQSRVSAAEESVEVAKAQRDKALAGASAHDISLARAKIRQAQAALDSLSKQIENNQIKAPIDGQITSVERKVGEQVGAGQTVFSLLGNGAYEIEVLISEADINKVKVGDEALITLDAFGDDKIMKGKVASIDPAETVIQDVIYYLVKVDFEQSEPGMKPGMTANVTITTNKKTAVISIPSRAIVDKGAEGSFVKLLIANEAKEQKIITGLRGDEGEIEIVDGLKAGDIIITQVIEK
jgi:HlyD family secretion protein